MKTLKTILLVLMSLASVSACWAGDAKEYRQFLMRLGFEDYSTMIRRNRERDAGIGTASESVLKFNQVRYQVFNYARELSILLIMKLHETSDPVARENLLEKMIALDAKLLNLVPFEPPTTFPDEVLAKKGEALEEAKVTYLIGITKQYIVDHTKVVLSDIFETLYGDEKLKVAAENKDPIVKRELSRIQELVQRIVEFTYLDVELGHTKFLARALTANLHKYAHDTDHKDLVKKLRKAAKNQGHIIENYIGDTLHMENKKGDIQEVKLKNGDFIMERSVGKEAGDSEYALWNGPI